MRKRIYGIVFLLFLLVGTYLRFVYLDWGKPYFFHPDENNITTAITNLSLHQWNPHFFAYGSLPIYITYLLSLAVNLGKQPTFPLVAYTLRFISAFLSLLLIPSLFYIGTKMFSKKTGFIAAILATTGTGLIQFAHFGTFEMWLTFFSLWFFYASFLFWKTPTKRAFFFVSCIAGILLSIKVSSIILLPIPLLLFLLRYKNKKITLLAFTALYISIIMLIYLTTNPYIILNTSAVINSLHYESSVALGTTQVFYTQSFFRTLPILFQLQYVFPFLLNPFIFSAFIVSFFFILFRGFKTFNMGHALLISFFLIIFLSQAAFFVKWTRYMVPCIPFIYLITGNYLQSINKKIFYILSVILFTVSLLYGFAFTYTAYSFDSRIAASNFAKKTIASQNVLVEPYDLGIVPFLSIVPKKTVPDLYSMDEIPTANAISQSDLAKSTVFLSLSQRLIRSRLMNPTDFPKGNEFYSNLYDERKFRIIYTTPCNLWCEIVYNGNPFYNVEETASVFDHPFITIFQKI